MLDSKKPNDESQRPENKQGSTPKPDDYGHYNSGRRASGHGGGDMDRPEEFPDEHQEPGYQFSGGEHGHEPNQSRAKETEEDMESRSGPYTRAGQPAQSTGGTAGGGAQQGSKTGKGGGSGNQGQ